MGTAGRLSLWWNNPVEIPIKAVTKNLIHTIIQENDHCDWFQALWIYGTPFRADKREFLD